MEQERDEVKVIIAGGGTGGHLFPGMAVAEEIIRKYKKANILFVTGRRRMESEILARSGFPQVSISVEGIKGRGWKKGVMVLLRLPLSIFQSALIIRRHAPHLVFGVGGYSAGPVCLTARIMGVPTAIHEQNSYPGLTNRLLCRIVDRVFISFEESRGYFPGGSIHLTGNPIREGLLKEDKPSKDKDRSFTILVVGGSQGARAINRAFIEALGILKEKGKEPEVIHQTGEADHAWMVDEYRRMGLEGEIMPFIQDMAAAYGRADLVVSRAGASSVSELAALGKPSILIPYPYAANNHQETNAHMLAGVGGAEMIVQKDLNGEGLGHMLMKYMDDRTALEKMGRDAKKMGRPDAAKVIVGKLSELLAIDGLVKSPNLCF